MTTKTIVLKPAYPGGPINHTHSTNLVNEYARTVPDAGKRYVKKKEEKGA